MTTRLLVPAAAVTAAATALAVAVASPAGAAANLALTGVAAQPRVSGTSSTNNLSPEWTEHPVAVGAIPLENPQDWAAYYGYNNDGPFTPSPGTNVEASKTEPDKNTYLVMSGLHGADAGYNYGTHFLYQGHETGLHGYITRVNLDAHAAHRITLIATRDSSGAPLPAFDGSVWDPFTGTLLFSEENGANGGIWAGGPDVGDTYTNVSGIFGQAGYEGIQVDSAGQIWLVEDTGGAAAGANGKGKQPNSFVYRMVPNDPTDLSAGGQLQALTILGPNNQPVSINADSPLETQLHTYGVGFRTRWTTVHDTDTDGFAPFSANALAKAADARRSSVPRTASSSRATDSATSSSPRPATRTP